MTANDDETEGENNRYSPAGFDAPGPEQSNGTAVCAGCGESAPVSEMGVTQDNIISNEDDAVLEVTRRYLHNDDDCFRQALGLAGDGDEEGDQ